MTGAAGLPWRRLMGFGLGRLGLPPEDFWAMTPREFQAAIDVVCGERQTPPARSDFEALMRAFPDWEARDGGDS